MLSFHHVTGEALQVTVEIRNHSSRSVKPKIILYEKRSFFAQGQRKLCTKVIRKEKIETVASASNETLTKFVSIPTDLPSSILNCSIIKLEYRLKVNCIIQCYCLDQEIILHCLFSEQFFCSYCKYYVSILSL